VDSSVVFKWFCADDESSVERALALLQEHIDGHVVLIAPAHMPAEVLNAFERRRAVSDDQLQTIAQTLAESEILYPAWDPTLLSRAAAIARSNGLTVYGALFVALAALFECELVTADRAQARMTECTVRLLL
jgi:predicted nucleic acid-binding protein